MWCAQFKSAERTFDLSQPVLYCLDKIRTCGLSATHMMLTNINIANEDLPSSLFKKFDKYL